MKRFRISRVTAKGPETLHEIIADDIRFFGSIAIAFYRSERGWFGKVKNVRQIAFFTYDKPFIVEEIQ